MLLQIHKCDKHFKTVIVGLMTIQQLSLIVIWEKELIVSNLDDRKYVALMGYKVAVGQSGWANAR